MKKQVTYVKDGKERIKGTSVSYDAKPKYRIPLLTQRELSFLIDAAGHEESLHKKYAREVLDNDHYKSWEGRQDAHDLQLDNAEVLARVTKILWWTYNPTGIIDFAPDLERLDKKQKIVPDANANAIQLVNNAIYHLNMGFFDKYAIIENLKKVRTMLGGKTTAGID
jgi:hypothetical protein